MTAHQRIRCGPSSWIGRRVDKAVRAVFSDGNRVRNVAPAAAEGLPAAPGARCARREPSSLDSSSAETGQVQDSSAYGISSSPRGRSERTAHRRAAPVAVAACAAVLSILLTAGDVRAQTEIWSAELVVGTAVSGGDTLTGFNHATSVGSLTPTRSIRYKGRTANLDYLLAESGNTSLQISPNFFDVLTNWKLHVGSKEFDPADAAVTRAVVVWTGEAPTWSVGDTVTVKLTTTEPGPPRNVSATGSGRSATLSWTAPSSIGGSAISGYEYRRSTDGGSTWGSWTPIPSSASLTSYVVSGLSYSTTHTFQMRAQNNSGSDSGLYSDTFSASTASLPPLSAQREIWSGTLTAASFTLGGIANIGFEEDEGGTLSPDTFVVEGDTYRFTRLSLRTLNSIPYLHIEFTACGANPEEHLSTMVLHADTAMARYTDLEARGFPIGCVRTFRLDRPGVSWAAGDTAQIRLTDTRVWELTLSGGAGTATVNDGQGSSVQPQVIEEGGSDVTATLRLASGPVYATDRTVTLKWGGLDLSHNVRGAGGATTITIPAGARSGTLVLNAPDQGSRDYAPRQLGEVTAELGGVLARAYLLWRDDEEQPVATIEAENTMVTEGEDIRLTVRFSPTVSAEVETVPLTVTDANGALSGAAPTALTIPAGSNEATFTLSTDDDMDTESAGEVTIEIGPDDDDPHSLSTEPRVYALGTERRVTVTVRDNDSPPGAPRLRWIHSVADGLTVQWEHPEYDGGSPLTGYGYRHSDDGGNTWIDWTAWPDHDGRRSLVTGGIHNLAPDTEYTVEVRARNANGWGPASNRLKGTPAVGVRFKPTESTTADEGDTVKVTLELGSVRTQPVTVWLNPVPGDHLGKTGRLTADDYTPAVPGSFTIPAGQRSASFDLHITDDEVGEPAEAVVIELRVPDGYATTYPYMLVTVNESDGGGEVRLPYMSVNDAEARESGDPTNNSFMSFLVWMKPAAPETVRVDYATEDVTATAGEDYEATSGTLVFNPGETSGFVHVTILDDEEEDDGETFRLKLSNMRGAPRGWLADSVATGTIRNAEEEVTPEPLDRLVLVDAAARADLATLTDGVSVALDDPGGGSYTIRADAVDGATFGDLRMELTGTKAVWRVIGKGAAPYLLYGRTGTQPLGDALPAGSYTIKATAYAGGTATTEALQTLSASFTVTASNNPATGAPTIGGTARVGEELSASTGDIADDDGMEDAAFAYQWIRGSADIDGATDSTYTLVAADEGERIKVRVTFEDDAGNDESATSAPTGVVEAEPAPLTASFDDVPASHTGAEFTFGLTFSEEPDVGYETLRDDAFEVTGGEVRAAQRQEQGSNLAWTITVEPSGDDAVTIALPETTDCAASGAICTDDDRPLSHSLSATVDAPSADPSLSVADASANEGDTLTFTVSLSAATSSQVSVAYATSDGTATEGDDFTAASGTLTFDANETSKTVSVATVDDDDDEGNETFTLTLSSPAGATLGDGTATGTIVDDDEPPTPTVSVADASASEGSAVEFTVSLSAASSSQVTVAYATSDGTAESGTDFTAASGTLTFAPNETEQTVSVATVDDDDDEENETFTLTLSGPTNATLGDGTATGTILDDDEAAAPLTATFDDMPASHTGDEFTFRLAFSEEVDLSYKTLEDEAFQVTGGEITSASRQQQGSNKAWSVVVEPSGDDAVTITLPETTDCAATGAICTDDDRPLSHSLSATVDGPSADPALSVADASATEGEAVEFTVSLSTASSSQVTVAYATADGTATEGDDFTAASGTLTFDANETEKTVSVATVDDDDDEENETFTLTLSSPTNATLGDATATGTIVDDDEAAPLTASFADMPASHDGAADFTFELEFSEEPDVGYQTLRDEAFEVTGGEVSRARRMQQGSNLAWEIEVEPSGNADVTIVLPETTDCSAAGAICTADDRPLSHSLSATVDGPTATPTLSVADASATEGGAVDFTVSLSAASSSQVTVDYATSGGTATSGTDFTAASGTLTFAANETSQTVSVSTTDDSDDESSETFTLTLSNASGADLGDATATGTIVDDDDAPTPTVSVADASATEGGAVGFTVSLSAASSSQVTVAYATAGGTATSGTDFTAASGTLTFAANETSKTVSVQTADDSDDESNETFTLTLSSPAGATLGDATATGTIVDDDEAATPLTASFSDMPASHTGAEFTFGLEFSEEPDVGYQTLRDEAFTVTGGDVRRARRQQQGSNQAWTIHVEPASATDTVKITLPETTDCNAGGAICTDDDRPLSHSLSATVVPAAASASRVPNRGAVELDEALAVADGLTPDEATGALFGEVQLSEARLAALDRLGNRNGRYDLGDVLSWIDRCRRGEARCGTNSGGSGPGAAAALFAVPWAGRGGGPRRTGRRDSRRRGRPPRARRRSMGRHALVVLLAAAVTWSCTGGDLTGPPAAAVADPGFLTVEWTGAAASADIGVLIELEGPGIEAVQAPGYELYQSGAPGPRQLVVAGSLRTGPLVEFRVPDRNQLPLYRVRVVEVTGEDYQLRDVDEYRAVIANN